MSNFYFQDILFYKLCLEIHFLYIFHSIPVGVVVSVLLTTVWLSELLPQPDVDWDRVGVIVYVISALIELPSEPLWVMAQDTDHVFIKVSRTLFPKP